MELSGTANWTGGPTLTQEGDDLISEEALILQQDARALVLVCCGLLREQHQYQICHQGQLI